jgi:hypothetical protein
MERSKVYEIIDGERDYQDSLVGNKYEEVAHPVAAEILMMEEYVSRARQAWTKNKGDEAALAMVRKATALGVRCMEHHGAPAR